MSAARPLRRPRLALGPLLYHWPRERIFRFYDAIANAPVDSVYLGEIVCARRQEMSAADWFSIADALTEAGKEAILSTPLLTEGEGDLKRMRRIAGNLRFRVEANDLGAVRLLSGTAGWVAGPQLNIYNPETLALMAELGATRWVAPVETSHEAFAALAAQRPRGLEAEVFAWGRLPLAISARCFTARRFNLQKEACALRCLEFPDGLALDTREGKPFLTLNGLQTQSAEVYSIAADAPGLAEAGADVLRVSPQAEGTVEILEVLAAAGRGEFGHAEALRRLAGLAHAPLCGGFWHGRPGMEASVAAQARA